MDSKNLFEIKFATQHSLDIGIVAPKSGNVDMQLMTDHKVSDFVTKKSYHAVTVVSNYPVKATSDTVSVDPFCCSSNSLLLDTDVLRCELCVIPQHYLRLLAPCCNPTKHFKHIPYRDEYKLQELKPPGCQLHLRWRCSDTHDFMSHCVESIPSI